MKQFRMSVLAVVSLFAVLCVRVPSAQCGQLDKLSLEAVDGSYVLPGMLLGMDKSIVKHPQKLDGEMRSLRMMYALSKHNLIGVSWVKIAASGDGAWARSDTAQELAKNNVAGVITGRTDIDLNGVTLDYEYRFGSIHGIVTPYVRTGLGLGELTVRFNGKFVGHETQSGMNYPVTEDAKDAVKRTVPIVNVEAGMRVQLYRHLGMSVAGFWDTGYGGLGAFDLRF
ncbi:hypothetical protein KGO95_03465 [Patescibacteria group bacterium]|nr:hypothetical protein [Patescibacteria group bacterium]